MMKWSLSGCEFPSSGRGSCMGAESLGRLWGQEESSMNESAKIPGHNTGLICRVKGRVYCQTQRVRRRFSGVGVLVNLMWDVT